ELPRAGGRTTVWGGPVVWAAFDRYTAYGISATGEGGRASISSCFYLLVKYLEMPPRVFVCPSDIGTSEFKLADEDSRPDFKLSDAWDFGPMPADNCSYTYHIPFGLYALSTAGDPNLAVAADRNPWIMSPAADVDLSRWSSFVPDIRPWNGDRRAARLGNAISHEQDGQNVFFLDGHVAFESRSYCSLEGDNIYTRSTNVAHGDAAGIMPRANALDHPANRRDSFLLHDPPIFPPVQTHR
ncbi:MAG: hypothetical protein JSW27_02025, partial [Phycisphaerales bacterium]